MVRVIVSGMLVLFATGCGASDIRPPAVAGAFYKQGPQALDRQVAALLQDATRPATTGRLVAAVAPHAGYRYSGPCAASAYSLVSSGQYDRVIILCPSHHVLVEGVSLPAPELAAYATPLGNVAIDRAACAALKGKKGFVVTPEAGVREHALEVQLPFLQKTAGSFRLVPLICGPGGVVDVEAVSEALAPLVDGRTLLVASSDFTHFGPNYAFEPFSGEVREKLQAWLSSAAGSIAALDEKGFRDHLETTHDTVCGEIPIRILMATLRKSGVKAAGVVLETAASGEMTGDYRNSVSYAAIGFFTGGAPVAGKVPDKKAGTRKEHAVKETRSGSWSPGLSDVEKATLFALAKDTLDWCVNGKRGDFDFSPYAITPLLKSNMATFVTLKIRGELRGCIGSLAPVDALYRSVHDNAVNAALRDPRFDAVRPAELGRIEVDVSVLSPIRDIGSIAEFKLGQQGIILEKGRHRAVYLPEVATEQGWTVEETLSSLSMKAGLPADAWREGARFKVFESVVLSE